MDDPSVDGRLAQVVIGHVRRIRAPARTPRVPLRVGQ
jgi:hypothetical protein